jgi:RNA-binding protein 25
MEKVARGWIAKKIKEYMGVEEPTVVQHILKILGRAPNPDALRDKLLKDILDEKTEEFVFKLWQTLVFENMKIDEGLYNNN